MSQAKTPARRRRPAAQTPALSPAEAMDEVLRRAVANATHPAVKNLFRGLLLYGGDYTICGRKVTVHRQEVRLEQRGQPETTKAAG